MSNKLIHLIADECDVTPDMITGNTRLTALGLDSLEFVELILRVQREFDCEISDEAAAKIETVDDLRAAMPADAVA